MFYVLLKRRLGQAFSLGFMDYCFRCERWLPAHRFYHTDEEGIRTRHEVCSRCQVHPVHWNEDLPFN